LRNVYAITRDFHSNYWGYVPVRKFTPQ
jgi:hypothetical protein